MDYKYSLFLVGIVVLSGCAGGPQMIDCGSDLECYRNAAQTCTPAKVRATEEGTTIYSELRGMSNNLCGVYMKIEDITLPAGVPPEAAGLVTMFEGKDMLCNVPLSQAAGISEFNIGGNMTGEEFLDMCSGTLIDTLSSLMAMYGGMTGE